MSAPGTDCAALGLDVGGTFLKAVIVDDAGEVVSTHDDRVPHDDVLGFVLSTIESLLGDADAAAIGLGVAGLVRWPEGEFVWGPHVSGTGIAFREALSEAFGLPVVVDNDANMAAFAEATAGAGRGHPNVLMLTFGTGIGAGIVVDGSIYRGASFAGEMGHMTMRPNGALCACGRRGCWETLVSGARLDRLAADLARQAPDGALATLDGDDDPPSARHLVQAAELGDSAAIAILGEAGTWLGRGVANLVAILDPDIVVVGGAVANAGEWLLVPARAAIASHLAGAAHRTPVDLVPARFGRSSGAVGAALLAQATARPQRPVQTRMDSTADQDVVESRRAGSET